MKGEKAGQKVHHLRSLKPHQKHKTLVMSAKMKANLCVVRRTKDKQVITDCRGLYEPR